MEEYFCAFPNVINVVLSLYFYFLTSPIAYTMLFKIEHLDQSTIVSTNVCVYTRNSTFGVLIRYHIRCIVHSFKRIDNCFDVVEGKVRNGN